jgi:hypothetical protein
MKSINHLEKSQIEIFLRFKRAKVKMSYQNKKIKLKILTENNLARVQENHLWKVQNSCL